jgi:hypothetical protein
MLQPSKGESAVQNQTPTGADTSQKPKTPKLNKINAMESSLTYCTYFAEEAQAEAFAETLPFGGIIEVKNGWFHVWANK